MSQQKSEVGRAEHGDNRCSNKVLPAMQLGEWSEIAAIASRDGKKAESVARKLRIPKAYWSYEELARRPGDRSHLQSTAESLACALVDQSRGSGQARAMRKAHWFNVWPKQKRSSNARDRTGVKIGEAFMVRTHPQWLRTRELIRSGRIGELRSIVGAFSYFNRDAANIRNVLDWGGGGIYDIGCYPINTSRFIFGEEPSRVIGLVERDPEFKIDRLASVILDFRTGQSIFTCSTQLVPYQRMQFLGTKGRIEIEIPFNAPNDRPCRIFIDDGRDVFGGGVSTETFPTCDQYTIQGDVFSRAIRGDGEVPVSLEDAIGNMAVIEAIFRSAETGRWERP